MYKKNIFLFLVFIFLNSCSHTLKSGYITSKDSILSPKESYDFGDVRDLESEIKKIGSLKKAENQEKLIHIFRAFQSISKNFDSNYISVPAQTKFRIKLRSFCLSPHAVIPDENEVFRWVGSQSKIILSKDVLDTYASSPEYNQTDIQDILWNLGNSTYYEDYPDRLKVILNKANPKASLILPSKIKKSILDEILPEELKNTISFVKGRYYSFSEFQRVLVKKKTHLDLLEGKYVSQIPDQNIFVSTKSDGYLIQYLSFQNLSNIDAKLKLSENYLEPVRADIQPLALAAVVPNLTDLQNALNKYAYEILGYIGSQYPTLNSEEKKLVKTNPIESAIVFYDAMIAEKKADELFPRSSIGGKGDATRHYIWSGLLVRDLGEDVAREFLNAHEHAKNQPEIERQMDEFNNGVGIKESKEVLKEYKFEDVEWFNKAKEAIKSGRLKIIKG